MCMHGERAPPSIVPTRRRRSSIADCAQAGVLPCDGGGKVCPLVEGYAGRDGALQVMRGMCCGAMLTLLATVVVIAA